MYITAGSSTLLLLLLLLLFINCNWAYARWQCHKNWTYVQEMDIHSKETKHTTREKAARTSHEKTCTHEDKVQTEIASSWAVLW
jgi:hypothetical protein